MVFSVGFWIWFGSWWWLKYSVLDLRLDMVFRRRSLSWRVWVGEFR